MISLGLKIKDVHSTIEVLKNTGLGFFSIEDLIPTFDSVYGKKIFAPNPLSFGLAALVCPVKYTKLVYGLSHYNIKLSASVLSNFGIRDAIISTCTDDHLRYIDEFGLFKHNYYLFLKDSSVGEVQKMNPIQEIGVPPYSTNDVCSARTAKENIKCSLDVLKGRGKKAHEDIIALNSGVILLMADKVSNLQEGYEASIEHIRNGRALQKLKEVILASGGDVKFI